MAKKAKLSSNQELAHPHSEGAELRLLQILVHDPLGAICYSQRRYWALHANLAGVEFAELKKLHSLVEVTPVDKSKMRTIRSDELLQDVYGTGTSMVSNVVRAIQHLTLEIMAKSPMPPTMTKVLPRLREVCGLVGLPLDERDPGHQAFAEMVQIRDAVEHPRPANVYAGDSSGWDRVPLAWMLSDRPMTTFPAFESWFVRLVQSWDEKLASMPAQPQTLTIQMRGLQADNQFKKPPL